MAISVSGVWPKRVGPNDIQFIMFAGGTHGDAYDLAAPAKDVITDGTFFGYDDHVQKVEGLSAAAAMVSGALGLMVAKDLSLNGQAQLLKDRLLCNSPSVGLAHLSVGNRVLDAFEAGTTANGCP